MCHERCRSWAVAGAASLLAAGCASRAAHPSPQPTQAGGSDHIAAMLPPPGYDVAVVAGLFDAGNGGVVLALRVPRAGKTIPIGIGPLEAQAILLRQAHKKPERPLTHDLLEAILKTLGGRLLRVEIREVRPTGPDGSGAFVARVFLLAPDGRQVDVDARSSDAMALALGENLPIYVARQVTDATGISLDALPPPDGGKKEP